MKTRSATPKGRPFSIVGIGGSAGGLEAFQELLRNLSARPGMAFVFIMHLAPEHKSMLAELLSRSTMMPLCEAKNRMPIDVNHVYVIPPKMNMSVSGGKLMLVTRKAADLKQMPVDLFFRSLAKEKGTRAIGVILSGTATDGTLGAEAIKAAGGITFVQDVKSAKYAGMPQSAIDAGCADFILPPGKIAHELEVIARHPFLASARLGGPPGSAIAEKKGLEGIFDALRSSTGLDFTQYKTTTIGRRISRRMVLLKLRTLGDYARVLREHPEEAKSLSEDLLINVTSFFRDPKTFDALRKRVLPVILNERTKDQKIRVWVAGCASGEEAYSLAICLAEALGPKADAGRVTIFATDISERSIAKARKGVYGRNIRDDVTPERLKRFFIKEGDSYKISKQLREMCVFSVQNAFSDPPFSNLDLISCRNTLIYLQSVLQRSVFHKFHYALKPNGFLLLGSAESAAGYANLFTILDRKQKIFVKKYLPRICNPGLGLRAVPLSPLAIKRRTHAKRGKETESTAMADRIVLNDYAPCGVLINSDMEVVQFRGHTGRYLESAAGPPSLDVFRLVREGLLLPLRTAIFKAKKVQRKVTIEADVAKHHGCRMRVQMTVIPLRNPIPKEECFLVLFKDVVGTAVARELSPGRRRSGAGNAVIADLQRQLAETKEYLQTVIEEQEGVNEEVKSANEEILSSNEELQSTNEELETAKEELQSSNEELLTANEELQNRHAEASLLTNDLINLLNSINMPVVMMGIDFTVRRITPQTEKALNIVPADIGRPIGKIKLDVEIPDLEKILSEVVETLHPKTIEARGKEGSWYSVYVRPYRTVDNKIDGVVMIFVDISSRRKSEVVVQQARAFAESILQTMREPLIVLGMDLKVVSVNRAFYREFKAKPRETIGRFVYDLGNGQWNIPRLRRLLEDILPRNSTIDDYEIEHEFESIGKRTMLLNARRIAAMQLILITVEDVTERQQREEERAKAMVVETTAEVERKGADAIKTARHELEETRNLLFQSKRMTSLGELSAGIAHELGNPLIGILNLVRIYMKRVDARAIEPRDLKDIEQAATYMLKIIQGLTDFSKPSAGRREPILCSDVIDSALTLLKGVLQGAGVEVRVTCDKGLPAVYGDRTQLQQVAVNMVANALDAMADTQRKRRLEIGARGVGSHEKRFVEMTFADNGCGMSKAVADRIFDPFFSTKKIGGVGLGLSTTYAIITKHGGHIVTESSLGRGTTFRVRLPVAV